MSVAWLQILSDYCNFGTLKLEWLLINISVSNNYKSFFFSKTVDAFCQNTQNVTALYYSLKHKH